MALDLSITGVGWGGGGNVLSFDISCETQKEIATEKINIAKIMLCLLLSRSLRYIFDNGENKCYSLYTHYYQIVVFNLSCTRDLPGI